MLTLLLVPLVGVLGMATEASSWFMTQRSMQNAADSAVMAAAANGCDAAAACHTASNIPTYDDEAKAVVARFGYVEDARTTIAVANDAVCPDGTTGCYSVKITRLMPLHLTRLVGFDGDVALGGGRAQRVEAGAMASPDGQHVGYCMVGLGAADNAIDINGAPNLGGDCSVATPNGGAECTNTAGLALKYADVFKPAKSSKKCGNPATGGERSPVPASGETQAFLDGLAAKKSNIPDSNTACGGVYPQGSKKTPISGENSLTGPKVFSSSDISGRRCGNVQLAGNVTVTADSVLVIHNGSLDLQGYKLSTVDGAHLTLIFSGTSGSYDHTVIGTGTLDIQAPSSGPWAGVAIYQNPTLTSGVNLTYHGSTPDFNVTGLVYAPNAEIDIAGAIGPSEFGDACLSFVGKTIRIAGTANIFASPTRECDRAGLSLPGTGSQARRAIVR